MSERLILLIVAIIVVAKIVDSSNKANLEIEAFSAELENRSVAVKGQVVIHNRDKETVEGIVLRIIVTPSDTGETEFRDIELTEGIKPESSYTYNFRVNISHGFGPVFFLRAQVMQDDDLIDSRSTSVDMRVGSGIYHNRE